MLNSGLTMILSETSPFTTCDIPVMCEGGVACKGGDIPFKGGRCA